MKFIDWCIILCLIMLCLILTGVVTEVLPNRKQSICIYDKKECIVRLKITKLTNSYLITAINDDGVTYTNDYILIDPEGDISITNAYENITVPITRTLE